VKAVPKEKKMNLENVLFFVVLVEAVVQNLKLIYDGANHKLNVDVLISLIISVGACVAFRIDIFRMSQFESLWAPLGSLLTGIVISRGAGFVHDIFEATFIKG
jgi:hypothetical protein